MTAVEPVGAEYARQLTDRIKVAVEGTWQLIAEAYQSRAWSVLGYTTWDDYCTREFGTARLKLPHEERMGTVKSLRQSGLSIRAIVAATGVSDKTVMKDLRQVSESTTPESMAIVDESTGEVIDPDFAQRIAQRIADEMAASDAAYAETAQTVTAPKVTGIDGKQYAAKTGPSTPRQKPIAEQATALGWEIRKAMERLERIVTDKRFAQNEEQVALALRGHLLYAADTVAAVLAQIP